MPGEGQAGDAPQLLCHPTPKTALWGLEASGPAFRLTSPGLLSGPCPPDHCQLPGSTACRVESGRPSHSLAPVGGRPPRGLSFLIRVGGGARVPGQTTLPLTLLCHRS